MQSPIFLLGPTRDGGSVIPVADSAAGDLRGFTLLSQIGPAVTIEASPDQVVWTPATLPLTLAGGFLRLIRTDESADATLISASLPDPPGKLPAGGVAGQLLGKEAAEDYVAAWVTGGVVPAGGNAGEVLAKSANGDFAVGWIPAPPAEGGGTTLPVYGTTPPSYADGPGSGTAQVKQVQSIEVVPAEPGTVSTFELPGTHTAATVSGIYASDPNDSPLFDADSSALRFEAVPNGRTSVHFGPVYLGVGARIRLSFAGNTPISMKPTAVSTPDARNPAVFTYEDDASAVQTGFAGVILSGEGQALVDGPLGHYLLPIVNTPYVLGGDAPQNGYVEVVAPADYSTPARMRLYWDGGFTEVFFARERVPQFAVGQTYQRPADVQTGDMFYDTSIHKQLWYDGGWRDATGTLV